MNVKELVSKYGGTTADIAALKQEIEKLTEVVMNLEERLSYWEGKCLWKL